MKKTKRFTAILLAAVVLGGCGNSGVSQEEYDRVVAERDDLQKENERLQKNYDTAVEDLASLQASITIDEIKNEVESGQNSAESQEAQSEQADIPKTRFESGQYKVGTDIEAGEYVFFTESGKGYFSVSTDSNGSDIIANDNFSYNSIMRIEDGEYLKLSRCYAVPIEEAQELPINKANMFKIGIHLSAGEYKLLTEEKGYYGIYSDDRQQDIVANDNFDSMSYITVSDGQYLKLSRCYIEQ